MAFIRRAADDGEAGAEWREVGVDPDTKKVVELYIRPISEAKVRAVRDSYGVEREMQTEALDVKGNKTHVLSRVRVLSNEDIRCIQRDLAIYATIGSRGLCMRAEDEETATHLRKLEPALAFGVGENQALDDRIRESKALRFNVYENDSALSREVAQHGQELWAKFQGKKEALAKNS
jgi:hypothetical protein